MTDSDMKTDLLRYLQDARDALLWKLDGLSEYDVRRPVTPTGTNLLGLVKHLTAAGIGTALHYPLPIPGQPLFRRLGYDAVACPAAWAASQQVLSLPCFPELRDDEVDAVIGAIRGYFEGEPP